jgi:hypothetical protein
MVTAAFAAMLAASCGGGSTPSPPGPTVTDMRTFMGTARALSATSCAGDSHDFDAADGPIVVTLVQSTGAIEMAVQVCAGGIDNNDCSINLTPIVVGQTVNGTRKGGARQNLKLNPPNCGPRGGPVPPGPVDYTVTVTVQR